jgi:hypothetical protein
VERVPRHQRCQRLEDLLALDLVEREHVRVLLGQELDDVLDA